MNPKTCKCGSTDLKPNMRSVGAICHNCYQAELTTIEQIKGKVNLRLEARYSDARFQLRAYRQDNSFLLRDYPDFCTIKTLDEVLSNFLSLF